MGWGGFKRKPSIPCKINFYPGMGIRSRHPVKLSLRVKCSTGISRNNPGWIPCGSQQNRHGRSVITAKSGGRFKQKIIDHITTRQAVEGCKDHMESLRVDNSGHEWLLKRSAGSCTIRSARVLPELASQPEAVRYCSTMDGGKGEAV